MEPLYAVDSFNYPDGYPLALLAATVGMFLGVICGAVLVNLAPLAGKAPDASGGGGGTGSVPYSTSQRLRLRLRKMGAAVAALKATAPESDHYGPRERPAAATQTVSAESLDSLMFHVCLVLCVMCVGYVLRLPVVVLDPMPLLKGTHRGLRIRLHVLRRRVVHKSLRGNRWAHTRRRSTHRRRNPFQ